MVFARLSLEDYTNKVLNVIKAQFGLRDKSEALNKSVSMFGDKIVERKVE